MLRDLSWLKRVKLIDKDGNLIDNDNPLPILYRFFYKINWTSDTDFNKGSLTDTEIDGTYDDASLQLEDNADNSDDIPFTTPGNYIYNASEIEFLAGKAQLKSSVTEENDWPFTTPANYTYDANKTEVTGGVAKLKGNPVAPYAWYHLNESSGTVVTDSSGNGRTGTAQNTEDADWVVGKLNNCLELNQLSPFNEYVNCGDIANFERTDAFSIEFWVNPTVHAQGMIQRFDGSRGWCIFTSGSGELIFDIKNGATNYIRRRSVNSAGIGQWTHVICTYDGSSSLAGTHIYINGLLSDTISGSSDTLTATIQNTWNCELGRLYNYGNYHLRGKLDECVIYDKELTSDEVTARYNSGTGSESMPGAFSLDNPSIYPITGFVFTSEITGFTETSTKPTNTEIKYHVSSDDGVTWKYWNGSAWIVTDNSYTQANLASIIHNYIDQLASSGTFRFRALLNTTDEQATAELDNIYIAVATYATGGVEVAMNWDIQPSYNFEYLTITETVIEPANTDIKYQYSINSGSTYNGSWLTASELETALQGISCVGDGSDKIRLKFQLLTTDANKTPQMDNLNIVSDAGYKTSGEFESNIYNSNYYALDWAQILFSLNLPSGCTIIIKVRASNNSSNMGSYGSPISSGDDLVVTGRYIQWKAEFVGNGRYTPKLETLSLNYDYPYRTESRP